MRKFLQITYPRKMTVAFHDVALSLLPVVLTLLVSFSFEISLKNFSWTRLSALWPQSEGGRAWCVSFAVYAGLILIVIGLRWGAEKHTCGKGLGLKMMVGYLGLACLGIATGLTEVFSPLVKLWATLAVAVCVALYSQRVLMLPEEYRSAAKSAPPLSRESWIRLSRESWIRLSRESWIRLSRESWIRIGALCNFVLASLFAFSIILYHL